MKSNGRGWIPTVPFTHSNRSLRQLVCIICKAEPGFQYEKKGAIKGGILAIDLVISQLVMQDENWSSLVGLKFTWYNVSYHFI